MASKSLAERVKTLTVGNPLIEHFKTAVFVYVVLTRLLKVQRHLRARGLRSTLVEFWTWVNKVRSFPCAAVGRLLMVYIAIATVCPAGLARATQEGGERARENQAYD